jgi:hypothetical protein
MIVDILFDVGCVVPSAYCIQIGWIRLSAGMSFRDMKSILRYFHSYLTAASTQAGGVAITAGTIAASTVRITACFMNITRVEIGRI